MRAFLIGGAFAAASACAMIATSADATNLLVNGSFETGDLTGWTVADARA
jgi:hypothetical protein